jgi:mannose-6-phosphate isomerase-like protein (cupin superfamily)
VDEDEGMLISASATSASTTHGAELTFETLDGTGGSLRLRHAEDTLLRVIDGIVRLHVEGAERLLGTGDEAIVPAGAAHRLAGASGEARVMMGFRALR